jgi:hypothetical protein
MERGSGLSTTIQQGWMEQRKHERVSTTLKVAYRLLDEVEKGQKLVHPHYSNTTADKLPQLSQKFHAYHAVTRDISESGLSLVGEHPFTNGAHVEVNMQLPQFKGSLNVLTVVMRTSSFFELGKTMYSAGVKMVAINSDDMKKLSNYLLAEKLKQQASQK